MTDRESHTLYSVMGPYRYANIANSNERATNAIISDFIALFHWGDVCATRA